MKTKTYLLRQWCERANTNCGDVLHCLTCDKVYDKDESTSGIPILFCSKGCEMAYYASVFGTPPHS
jgi:hypothetical protein